MKPTISNLLELSKYLQTQAGQDLQDPLSYLSSLAENFLRAMKNNLTFTDNIASRVTTVNLSHDSPQAINTDGKQPIGIEVWRIYSQTVLWTGFGWYINASGETVVTILFEDPTATKLDVTLAIIFG